LSQHDVEQLKRVLLPKISRNATINMMRRLQGITASAVKLILATAIFFQA
jgi:hypothetical protein